MSRTLKAGQKVWVFYSSSVTQLKPQSSDGDAESAKTVVDDSEGVLGIGSLIKARRRVASDNGWCMSEGEVGEVVELDEDGDPFVLNAGRQCSPEAFYASNFSLTGQRHVYSRLQRGDIVVTLRDIHSDDGWNMKAGERGIVVSLDRDGDPFVRNARGERSPEAFYTSYFHPTGKKAAVDVCFASLESPVSGYCTPRIGLTEGWVPGTVRADWTEAAYDPESPLDTGVCVELVADGFHYRFRHGEACSPGSVPGYECGIRPDFVHAGEDPPEAALTLLVFRWGGTKTCDPVHDGAGGWGATGSMVSDPYIAQFFTTAVLPSLGTRYRAYSIFVTSTEDLKRLHAPTLSRLANETERSAGLYFLWPVNYRSSDAYPGYVGQNEMLNLMSEVEASGVVTRFPHHSHLYRHLLSKDWMAHNCLSGYDGALTTKVPIGQIAFDSVTAARKAIESMSNLRMGDGRPWTKTQGVAKMGFAWEATDVRRFEDERQLAERLDSLVHRPMLATADSVMVQEWVDFTSEFRLFFVDPQPAWDSKRGGPKLLKPRAVLYTRFREEQKNSGCPTDFERFDRAGCLASCFSSDTHALDDAERQCFELASKCLFWMLTECSEPPPVMRMDFMVRRAGPGAAKVTLCEMTELGGCFLGWERGPRQIWGAVVRSCFRTSFDGTANLPEWVKEPAAESEEVRNAPPDGGRPACDDW
eukprot:Hpha_TRINITY_DN12949_c0_g1::TRINITY_DN12949_c0_g1_i1::g.164504::m.164504